MYVIYIVLDMSNDIDDDATPSLSGGVKTKTAVLRMNTPANSGSEISSNQSETRWSAIRKLQSSIKTPLMKGGVNNNALLWNFSETNQGKHGVLSSQKRKQQQHQQQEITLLSSSPSSIFKESKAQETDGAEQQHDTSMMDSPKTPGLNSPLKGKYPSSSSSSSPIATELNISAIKNDDGDEHDNIPNISINLSNVDVLVNEEDNDNQSINISRADERVDKDNNDNSSSKVSSLLMSSLNNDNINSSMNVTASPFNFGTPLSHRLATGSQSSIRRSSIMNNDNNNDNSNISFNIDDYGNTSSIQSSPLPDLDVDVEAMALALEESLDDGAPAPAFNLQLFPSIFQTGKGGISITEVYSSFASIRDETSQTGRVAGAMSMEQILKCVPHLKRPMVELLLETLVQHRLLRPFQCRDKIYWQCRPTQETKNTNIT
jgi:hypothetical protein